MIEIIRLKEIEKKIKMKMMIKMLEIYLYTNYETKYAKR